MRLRTRAAFALALLLPFGAAGGLALRVALPDAPHLARIGRVLPCQEDQVCWDWRTMGNHRRGVCIGGRWMLEHADGRITDDHPFSRIDGLEGCP